MSSTCTKVSQAGYILPPKVKVYRSRILKKDELVADRDNEQMIGAIDNLDKDKVLIYSKSTRQIVALISQTDFVQQLIRGYSYMFITAKTGAILMERRLTERLFNTLNEWGKTDKKFVVLHLYSQRVSMSMVLKQYCLCVLWTT